MRQNDNQASYRWIITRDFSIETAVRLGQNSLASNMGVEGPSNADMNVKMDNRWRCYDDDGELYYEGIIGGHYSGDEPLGDFCGPNDGCTTIAYYRKETGKWEVL